MQARRASVKSICDAVRAAQEAAAHLALVLAQQVFEEGLARIVGDARGRIEEAQRRGRDDRLLDRHARQPHRLGQIVVGVRAIAERPPGEPRPLAGVAGELELEPIGREVLQPVDAVGGEVVVLALLAVGDHRRAGLFEEPDGLADRGLIERVELAARNLSRLIGARGLNQLRRAGNAADRFGWYLEVEHRPWPPGNGRRHEPRLVCPPQVDGARRTGMLIGRRSRGRKPKRNVD